MWVVQIHQNHWLQIPIDVNANDVLYPFASAINRNLGMTPAGHVEYSIGISQGIVTGPGDQKTPRGDMSPPPIFEQRFFSEFSHPPPIKNDLFALLYFPKESQEEFMLGHMHKFIHSGGRFIHSCVRNVLCTPSTIWS
jgi:hypothetical protein